MKQFISKLAAVATVAMLFVAPVHAQATRTWVSGVGDDANPCSRTAPCKTFAGAISKTAAKGEINVLDPGGFGAVTITKAITIRSDRFEAGVLVSGTNAIIVNVPNAADSVILEGLDIEGLGTGLDGVKILGSGNVVVRNCAIRNFSGNGINLVGTTGAKVLVEDSYIRNNGGGVHVQGAAGVTNNAVINRTTIDTHTNFAVQVTGPNFAFLSDSQLIGGGPKLSITGVGGGVTSYGNNVIRGAGAAPTSTLPLQ